jgi:type IV secretory pathway VirB10-like protein
MKKLVDHNGWYEFALVEALLPKLDRAFDLGSYGHTRLIDLIAATKQFEVLPRPETGDRIRKKPSMPQPAKSQTAKPQPAKPQAAKPQPAKPQPAKPKAQPPAG